MQVWLRYEISGSGNIEEDQKLAPYSVIGMIFECHHIILRQRNRQRMLLDPQGTNIILICAQPQETEEHTMWLYTL